LGFCASLLALLRDEVEQVTHLAVAFDNPIVSFRNDLFAGYKSDEGVPPELRAQFDVVEEACRLLGVCVWSMRAFEADDALATAVAKYGSDVCEIRLLTPDKDVGQCLREGRVVQVDRIRKRVITEADFRARRGIAPSSMPDFLALVGDPQDGIPGLSGWGEKSAAAVLHAYAHLEHIPERAHAWNVKVARAEALASTLSAHREDALLYRTLATLRTDVPLGETLEELRLRKISQGAFSRLLSMLDTRSLSAGAWLE
jgi:5'-3' exonuclease